jgi:hypothetical protein
MRIGKRKLACLFRNDNLAGARPQLGKGKKPTLAKTARMGHPAGKFKNRTLEKHKGAAPRIVSPFTSTPAIQLGKGKIRTLERHNGAVPGCRSA